ncbi:DUF2855 family protein [Sneathiella glossodoripedis]|uniref:DUF2855 family protein n=1 Tax=Sneathiella glossodoripedis TaxID=418853 RepID=UPI00046E7E66|nr:DUF2855 family protein [Sneathiella glossodoripedis]
MKGRWSYAIDKDNIKSGLVLEGLSEAKLQAGEIEVAIKRFALTANNVTYATLGKSFGSWTDMPGYWAFFPHEDSAVGQLPIWGFAEVVRSAHDEVAVGEELYGFFPMASHLVMKPSRISAASLHDEMPHRLKLAPVYNQYNRVRSEEDVKASEKDLWPVFRPLLVTGYMICDQFDEAGFYGAEQILICSASSKTAMMTARCFDQFENVPRLIGVTSRGNLDYVKETGLYADVIAYEEVTGLAKDSATALIDMAGNGDVINAIHRHFEDNLKFSCLVGISHWDKSRPARDLPGAPIAPFFAPGRIKQRSEEWGGGVLQARLGAAWDSFIEMAPSLTQIRVIEGAAAAAKAYEELVAGQVNPAESLIIRL